MYNIYIYTYVIDVCMYTHTSTYNCRWPFQEPKLEVPTIYKAYIRPKFQGISPRNMAKNMVLTHLHFRILFDSHGIRWCFIGEIHGKSMGNLKNMGNLWGNQS